MKKLLALLTISFIGLTLLSGCDNPRNTATEYTNHIRQKGTLTIAVSADYPPFEFQVLKDDKNTIVGSDIQVAQAIADELDVKLVVQNMSFNTVLTSLAVGKVDMAISALSATNERRASFDFSDVYYVPENKMLVQKSRLSDFQTTADFDGKTIGAQKGTIQEDAVFTQLPKAREVGLASIPNLVNELKNGKLDGVMIEGAIAQAYVAKNPDIAFAHVPFESSEENAYAIALPKDSGDLRTEVNQVIGRLKAEGKINQFVADNFLLAEKSGNIDE